jgi:hypothetical protein
MTYVVANWIASLPELMDLCRQSKAWKRAMVRPKCSTMISPRADHAFQDAGGFRWCSRRLVARFADVDTPFRVDQNYVAMFRDRLVTTIATDR